MRYIESQELGARVEMLRYYSTQLISHAGFLLTFTLAFVTVLDLSLRCDIWWLIPFDGIIGGLFVYALLRWLYYTKLTTIIMRVDRKMDEKTMSSQLASAAVKEFENEHKWLCHLGVKGGRKIIILYCAVGCFLFSVSIYLFPAFLQ